MRGKANQGTEELNNWDLVTADGIEAAFSPTRNPPQTPPPTRESRSHGPSSPHPAKSQQASQPALLPGLAPPKRSRRSGAPSTPEVVVQCGKRLCLLARPRALNEYSVKEDSGILKMTQTLKCLEAVRRKFCATFGRHLC